MFRVYLSTLTAVHTDLIPGFYEVQETLGIREDDLRVSKSNFKYDVSTYETI